MEIQTRPNDAMEPQYLSAMKHSFNASIKKHLLDPVLGSANNFLKGALLHPGVAKIMLDVVDESVLEGAFQAYVMMHSYWMNMVVAFSMLPFSSTVSKLLVLKFPLQRS
jgi:hypothetical protein